MAAISVVLVCVVAAIAGSLLKSVRPELAMGVALAGGIAALFLAREDLRAAAELIRTLAAQSGVERENAGLLLRAAGIALVSEFGAELCRDAGESSLAGRIELGTRAALLVMAAPLLRQVLELIAGLLA